MRHRKAGFAVVFGSSWLLLGCGSGSPGDTARPRAPSRATRPMLALTRYVDPFIGTAPALEKGGVPGGSGGAVFPGPVAPFGMIQWSPDTPGSDPRGTYGYRDRTITGFSMTHFNGAGCPNNAEFPVLPALVGQAPAPLPFSHDREEASPGYYSVTFDNGIRTELTTTQRAGIGRFGFPGAGGGRLQLDATSIAEHHRAVATVETVDATSLRGEVTGGFFCFSGNTYKVYFHATFSRPFVRSGTPAVALLDFGASAEPLLMRVGLSYVSAANARLNLEREIGAAGFDAIRARTAAAWNEHLNAIHVTGGSAAELTKFYTALYRVLIQPNVFSDVNGEYIGFDNAVHVARGYTQYANVSGWDTYRSQVQLLALLYPRIASDTITSLIASARQCGGSLPKWTQNNTETGTMVGDPGSLIVASTYAFGARDFDRQAALRLMLRTSFVPGTSCQGRAPLAALPQYLGLGYIADGEWGPASTTLEYAMRDFAVAQYAEALGDPVSHRVLMGRARYWRNVLHPERRTIQQRTAAGGWKLPLNGPGGGHNKEYVEGNAEQYTWFLPYDAASLFERNGGVEASIARLDAMFSRLNAGMSEPYFYMGNEPSFATPWLYNWAGAPAKTQAVVRRIIDEVFTVAPDGLPGNDDLGATSSWLIWSMLGLYPQLPGVDGLTLAAPYFPDATIRRAGGGTIRIRTSGGKGPFIAAASLDGEALTMPWFRLGQVDRDRTIDVELAAAPTRWGTGPDVPPSFGAEELDGFDAARNHRAISGEGAELPAGADGFGFSYAAKALAGAGVAPGATVASGGITYRWPVGPLDSVIAQGQRIRLERPVRGAALGFLAAATGGPATGALVLEYADGARVAASLTFSDWTLNGGKDKPAAGNQIAVEVPYRNTVTGQQRVGTYVFAVTTPLRTDADLTAIVLPDQIDRGRIQLFAMGVEPPGGARDGGR